MCSNQNSNNRGKFTKKLKIWKSTLNHIWSKLESISKSNVNRWWLKLKSLYIGNSIEINSNENWSKFVDVYEHISKRVSKLKLSVKHNKTNSKFQLRVWVWGQTWIQGCVPVFPIVCHDKCLHVLLHGQCKPNNESMISIVCLVSW